MCLFPAWNPRKLRQNIVQKFPVSETVFHEWGQPGFLDINIFSLRFLKLKSTQVSAPQK